MTEAIVSSPYWSPCIRGQRAYVPGEQPKTNGWIKLNTNECPYAPSPLVLKAIQDAVSDKLRLYPDPNGTALKCAIASHFGLSSEHIFLGNGSDEVLGHAFLGLLKHALPILYPDVTYSFYPVYCGLYDIAFRQVPVNANFEVNVADFVQPNGGIVLANPNAPTGVALSLTALRSLLKNNSDSVVLIDEAYADFGAGSCASLISEFDNLLVVQTFSKSRALAGLRVGFALGHPALIEGLSRVKDSFNSYPLDSLALVGAQAAIEDQNYFEVITSAVVQSRDWLTIELTKLGFVTLPSKANFVFTHHPFHQATDLLARLREQRILVRHFPQTRTANHLRISVGTQQECETLVRALQQMVSSDHGSKVERAT